MREPASQRQLFFEGQVLHFACLLVLLAIYGAATRLPGFDTGAFLGLSTSLWAALAVADAVIHQLFVWICWRLELHGQHLSRRFGKSAFPLYQVIFAILIILRPLLAFALGWSNRGTLPIEPWLGIVIGLILLAPSLYLVVSIKRYFGFDRAFGIDHFDPAYRDAPLVRQGIFAWTPNAMYVFGFFMLWAPAFLFQSVAALVVAAFSHAYIWVHYFATERPDMRRIYG